MMDTKLVQYKKYNYCPVKYEHHNNIFHEFLSANENIIKNSDKNPSSFFEWYKAKDIAKKYKRDF